MLSCILLLHVVVFFLFLNLLKMIVVSKFILIFIVHRRAVNIGIMFYLLNFILITLYIVLIDLDPKRCLEIC